MLKKFLSILTVITVLVSSLTFNVFANTIKDDEITIRLLATSDIHNKFYPYEYATNMESKHGSLAQIATVIKELKTENTIVIDAGDTIQGNYSELFLDEEIVPTIAGMNAIGYDIWTLGNHEFNYGMDFLEKVMKTSKAKILTGNVYRPDETALADDYTIIEKNGIKIGIIGMVTPNITRWDAEKLIGYKVTDPLEEINKAVEELKGKVDIIVSVNHMGESNEYNVKNSGVDDIAKSSKDIDVIIAAHEHKAVKGKLLNDILIVENKNAGETIAQIDITLKKDTNGKYKIIDRKSKLIDVSKYEPDKEVLKVLERYDQKAKKDANTIIGKLECGDLVPKNEIKGIAQAYIQDTALIDFINEVQLYYSGADISAAALLSTNANMKQGDIKKSDTSLIYKYPNTLYVVEMTGKQLKQYMEWNASYFNQYKDGDLTISFKPDSRGYWYDMFTGINYEINISKEVGNRIENLTKADGTPVKDTDVFKVALNNYRANSHILSDVIFKDGDKPKLLQIDVRGDIGGVRELIGDYIQNVKKGKITNKVDNNWKITGINWDKELHEKAKEQINSGKIKLAKYNSKSITVNDLVDEKNKHNNIRENNNTKIVNKKVKKVA
ncbi:5'-nucleotidase C-terminal domain-containing protein [[Clostridium] colinum]|uniref:5'-nucleotidase C-terminal domain-containing protein n=1 Tax=[Clostridium] colinum TaxID=36835 RepID=UPI00202558B3|nr:5'-nucleotidase C-terminal domain-containing protein [[Clostridium] colinum]